MLLFSVLLVNRLLTDRLTYTAFWVLKHGYHWSGVMIYCVYCVYLLTKTLVGWEVFKEELNTNFNYVLMCVLIIDRSEHY